MDFSHPAGERGTEVPGGVPGQAQPPEVPHSPFTSSFFSKSSSRRQAAPSSTPIHTSAQWVRRSAGQDPHSPRAPAPTEGLQWLHRAPLSLLSPTVAVNTHTCAGDRPRAPPQCCSLGATAAGDTGTRQTLPSPPRARRLLTLTCWHCPAATSCCSPCSSSPGCPAPCNNRAAQTAVPPALGTGVPVPPEPPVPGHGGPFLVTVLLKLARGVQAPRARAHSEAFPLCSSSRRSSARPGSAPGNVPGAEEVARRGQGGLPPSGTKGCPTLPPQQYSRSRRHWVSRTCPPLHTCPESGLAVPEGEGGRPEGQL